MKARITHLKAPWPAGAAVGSVVEFDVDAAPAWAAGKCVAAPDDADVTHAFAPQQIVGDDVQRQASAVAEDPVAAADAQAAAEKAALVKRSGKRATAEAT